MTRAASGMRVRAVEWPQAPSSDDAIARLSIIAATLRDCAQALDGITVGAAPQEAATIARGVRVAAVAALALAARGAA